MQKLALGQEVWGFIKPISIVDDTEHQAHSSVFRLAGDRFLVLTGGSIAGAQCCGIYDSQELAYAVARLPIDGEIIAYSEKKPSVRIKTAFDRVAA